MKKFEYLKVETSSFQFMDLDEYGPSGWELISHRIDNGRHYWIFKREI